MTETTRRAVLAGAVATAATPAWAQTPPTDDAFPGLPAYLGEGEEPDLPPPKTLGTAKPEEIDFAVAEALMRGAPYNCPPVEVALYLRAVGLGTLPKISSPAPRPKFTASELQARAGAHFARGWPHYYNPLIIHLFDATGFDPLKEAGDGTHWCAAFVNWCIARGRSTSNSIDFGAPALSAGTRSPSSGSFRCWRSTVASEGDLKPGDVVVWATEGTVRGCDFGTGHVAFFLEHASGGRLVVVGGNQRDPTTIAGATQSAICRKVMPRSYAVATRGGKPVSKVLHSFRTADFLRA